MKKSPNIVYPSASMLPVRAGRVAVQSRSSFHPKKMLSHPSGTTAAICSAETSFMAMTAMAREQKAMMTNWATSVMTTLIMPPRST